MDVCDLWRGVRLTSEEAAAAAALWSPGETSQRVDEEERQPDRIFTSDHWRPGRGPDLLGQADQKLWESVDLHQRNAVVELQLKRILMKGLNHWIQTQIRIICSVAHSVTQNLWGGVMISLWW